MFDLIARAKLQPFFLIPNFFLTFFHFLRVDLSIIVNFVFPCCLSFPVVVCWSCVPASSPALPEYLCRTPDNLHHCTTAPKFLDRDFQTAPKFLDGWGFLFSFSLSGFLEHKRQFLDNNSINFR